MKREIHKNYILKLIAYSPFITSSIITLKLNNNFEVVVHRRTVFRFLIKMSYKWKGSQIAFRINNKNKENRIKLCIKNRESDWSDVLITVEVSFNFLSPWKHRWVAFGDSYEKKKQNTIKKIMFGEDSALKYHKVSIFNTITDSK